MDMPVLSLEYDAQLHGLGKAMPEIRQVFVYLPPDRHLYKGMWIAGRDCRERTVEDYGRRLVVNLPFDRAVIDVIRVLREEGLDVTGRFNVREYLRRRLHHDFRRYVLLQATSPQLMLDALGHDLGVGAILPVTIAVYELADGETAVLVSEPFAPVVSDQAWREAAAELASLADQESEQLGRALARLQRLAPRQESVAFVS